jgi:endonuclease-3
MTVTKRRRSPRKVAQIAKTEEIPQTVVTPDAALSNKRARRPDSNNIQPDAPVSSSSANHLSKKKKKSSKKQSKLVVSSHHPTPEECLYATVELGKLHPEVLIRNDERRDETLGTCAMEETILDGVIGTILSQNTTSANSTRAFDKLKKEFPTWDLVEALPNPSRMEEAIRSAGLAKIKSERIYKMLQTIKEEQGEVSLEYLRKYSDDEVKNDLGRFKGMGPKTISCVMLFAMKRPEFPVDTHVHRICQQVLKWIGLSVGREDAYTHLNATVPAELKLDLHCLLIAHGKQCHRCAARGKPQFPPKDGSKLVCPLANSKKNSTKNMVKVEVSKQLD